MKQYDKNDLYQNSVIGLTLAGFLGTAALFFAGLLITQVNSFNNSIRLPIVYLICCTVGLVYAAIIYANIAGHAQEEAWHLAQKHNHYANVISEFLGVYIFLLSMPLVINAITKDMLIRVTVAAVILASLILYTKSPFSILSRMYNGPKLLIASMSISLWGVLLLLVQTNFTKRFVLVGLSTLIVYMLWAASLLKTTSNER